MKEQSIFANYKDLIQKRDELDKLIKEEYYFITKTFSKWKVGDKYNYPMIINGKRYREMRIEKVDIRRDYPTGYKIVYTCYPYPDNKWCDTFTFSEKELFENIENRKH